MSFSPSSLEKKLADLTSSQQSVQTLSLWLIHHRKHAKAAVEVWHKELEKAHLTRKLTFMYLANDVLQNGKRKGPEYNKEFHAVLQEAVGNVISVADAKMRQSMDRILHIWRERGVFENDFVDNLQAKAGDDTAIVEPKKKKRRKEPDASAAATTPTLPAPGSEELLQHLKELESAASSDDALRMQIASLPEDVQDTSLLQSVDNQAKGEALMQRVEEAIAMLKNYNVRLDTELQQREKTIGLLQAYTQGQEIEHERVQASLEDYKQRLNRIVEVQQQLRSHLANLPDMSQLPQYASGLAPLPSAHDLFS